MNCWENRTPDVCGGLWDIQFIKNEGWSVGFSYNEHGYVSFIMYSNDYGKNWQLQAPSTQEHLRDVFFLNNKVGWAVGSGNTIIHTTNGGWFWITDETVGPINYTSIYFTDSLNGWIVGQPQKYSINILLRTTNGGKEWKQQNIEFPSYSIRKIFFIDSLNGWITGAGPSYIYRTEDGGKTWKEKNLNITDQIFSLFFIDKKEGWICGGSYERGVGSSSMIMHTVDGGENWEIQNIGRPFYVNDIEFIDRNRGWAVAGAPAVSCGVYSNVVLYTNNGGSNWWEEATNTNIELESIFIDDSLNAWTIGIDNWGKGTVLYSKIDTMSVDVSQNRSLEMINFSFSPNPATDYLEISYSPSINRMVNHTVDGIAIFNVFGQKVLSSSQYSAKLDVSGLSPGVYFMKVGEKVGKFVKI